MDYPIPIKRPGTKVLYFFYTDPITGKRHQKSTGKKLKREAKEFIRNFIDDLYGFRVSEPKNLLYYIDLFSDPETNPKYQEALITEAHYTLGHAKSVARIMKHLKDEVLKDTSYLGWMMKDFSAEDIKKIAQLIVEKYGQTRKSQSHYIQVKALFNYAADNHQIPYSPAAKLRNIKYEETKRKPLSLDALKVVLNKEYHQSNMAHAFISFAVLTGMRRGELIALHSSQFSDGKLLIDRALNDANGEVKETKSYHNRLIPLSESAQKVIAPFLDEPIVFHHSGRMIHTRNATDWYVFFRMNVAKSDLSIEIKREIEQSTLHSLRHSLATHLRFAGVHDAVVRYYCGWELDRDKDMLTRYSHAEMYLQECADMIDQLFSGKILSFSNAVNYQNK